MNAQVATPKQNRILAALPGAEYQRLEAELEATTLHPGQVIYEAGDSLDFVYFPTAGLVSLIWTTQHGATSGLAMTGNEGLVGMPALFGNEKAIHWAVAQSACDAYRLRAEVARWVLDQGGALLPLVSLYAQDLIAQIAQIALCAQHHSIEQQVCRWLLLCWDRLPGAQLNMTQATLAQLLGVRRVTVSEAARKLQAAGLITFHRGQITLLDRHGLEAHACECYAALKAQTGRRMRSMPKALNGPPTRLSPKSLRARAEKQFKQAPADTPRSAMELDSLVCELQVHQIELEMQKEELINAYAEVDALRERYVDIYDFAPVAYVTVDTVGVIRQINLAGAILLGIKRSQILQRRFGAVVSQECQDTFNQFLAAVLSGHTSNQCEIELVPTEQRGAATVLIEAIPDETGQECRMVVSDITLQKKSTQALRQHEELLRSIFLAMAEGVVFQTADGQLIEANPAAEEILGLSRDELMDRTSYDPRWQAIHEDGTPYPGDEHPTMVTLRTGKPLRNQVMGVRVPAGGLRWVSINSMPITRNADGIADAVVATFTDITERRQSELALRGKQNEPTVGQSIAKIGKSDSNARARRRSGK
jgi:PAS domain S-box-containing protein